jgi:hypothetical protein
VKAHGDTAIRASEREESGYRKLKLKRRKDFHSSGAGAAKALAYKKRPAIQAGRKLSRSKFLIFI